MRTIIRNDYTPHVGDFCNKIVLDEENSKIYIFDCDGIYVTFSEGSAVWGEISGQIENQEDLMALLRYIEEEIPEVDSVLDAESENPVQNKVIVDALDKEATDRAEADDVLAAAISAEATARQSADDTLNNQIESVAADLETERQERTNADTAEADARFEADNNLQEQIDAIAASTDVKDIVGTHADLVAYDTSTLGDKDIIKVIADETQDGAMTYNRWHTNTSTWEFIGKEGPFYTKAETNDKFVEFTDYATASTAGVVKTNSIYAVGTNTSTGYIYAGAKTYAEYQNALDNMFIGKKTLDNVITGKGLISESAVDNKLAVYALAADIPTKISQLQNDSGYITNSALLPYAKSADLATVATTGSYSDLKDKPTIPAAQVNSDWNATSGKAQILNKPNLATVATSGKYSDLSGKPTIPTKVTDLSDATDYVTRTNLTQTLGNYATTSDLSDLDNSLADVAHSGSYNDLTDTPDPYELPTASATVLGGVKVGAGLTITDGVLATTGGGKADAVDWGNITGTLSNQTDLKNALDAKADTSSLATVATSGSYTDLSNQPTIPTKVADLSDGANYVNRTNLNEALGNYVKTTDYAAVNKPGIIAAGNWITVNATTHKLEAGELTKAQYDTADGKIFIGKTTLNNVLDESGFAKSSDLAAVATSGSYNDLTNKPTIPTVNNATLTIKRNGTSEGTFTANASANKDVDIKVDILAITEDKVTVTTDATKGVAPYSTSYGYTNIVADYPTPTEGSVVAFVINTKMVVASATRNVRVKFNDSDTWHPVMNASTTILAGSSYFTKAMTRLFVYKTTQQSIGALHMINDDNTTYGYLVNTIATGFHTVETGGYMARYAISFYTQPMKTGNKVSSFVTSSGTGTSKAYTSVAKYYADRGPVINYSANVAAAAATANTVYTYYQGMDLRYTANLSTTYIATNDHVFAYLKNFNPDDYSFEPSKDTKQIVSATKLATAFPSTTTGDIYLYLLGTNTGTYYTLNTPEKETNFIYKYTPSTGELLPMGGSAGGVTSFNGETGDVTYEAPVLSVNGQVGAVNIPGTVVDASLSTTSENPAQNKVITAKLNDKIEARSVSTAEPGSDAFNAAVKTAMAQEGLVKLQLTTTDPGEGSTLAANTLLGVYQ